MDFSEHFEDDKHIELLIVCINEYTQIIMVNSRKKRILLVFGSHYYDEWYVN